MSLDTIQVHIPMQSEEAAEATAHTPEPWMYNHAAIVQDSQGSVLADCEIIPPAGGTIPPPTEEVANARRICAAVNACKGIRTEALERGIVAELRHILGETVTAAGDLDAAIDGATDQFDAERNRLNAAIRIAQAALDDGGMEMNVHELLAGRKQIAAIWSIEDVQQARPDLTDEQAWQVLRDVDRHLDAELGVNWTTLECMADMLFGPAPETDSQE